MTVNSAGTFCPFTGFSAAPETVDSGLGICDITLHFLLLHILRVFCRFVLPNLAIRYFTFHLTKC